MAGVPGDVWLHRSLCVSLPRTATLFAGPWCLSPRRADRSNASGPRHVARLSREFLSRPRGAVWQAAFHLPGLSDRRVALVRDSRPEEGRSAGRRLMGRETTAGLTDFIVGIKISNP